MTGKRTDAEFCSTRGNCVLSRRDTLTWYPLNKFSRELRAAGGGAVPVAKGHPLYILGRQGTLITQMCNWGPRCPFLQISQGPGTRFSSVSADIPKGHLQGNGIRNQHPSGYIWILRQSLPSQIDRLLKSRGSSSGRKPWEAKL